MELRNDGAILSLSAGQELVLSSDTMVENLHFLPDDPPETVAQKLLRCNLSDLAAMGAKPYRYMLNVSVPPGQHYDDSWFGRFALGLQADQNMFGLSLLGGDTTGSPKGLTLTLTILGTVPKGQALRRDTAKEGDSVWVTGNLGKAALGLQARKNRLDDPDGTLTQAYRVPTPRVGLSLYGIVNAAMDISDGLLQDCGHIAEESHVSITLYESLLPFSPAVRRHLKQWRETILLGGDDYEILLTCKAEREYDLQKHCQSNNVAVTKIGMVTAGRGVTMLDTHQQPISFSRTGWQHF